MSALRPPTALTVAGSDSGGGAGIQADLKTFAAHGVHGCSAITAVTAQSSLGVDAVDALAPRTVAAQIDAVLRDIGADAVKLGMLANGAIVEAVADALARHRPSATVVDPVMIAASGDRLLEDAAVAALCERLLPLATVVTPNAPEAEALTGIRVGDEASMESAARELIERGSGAALIKGGHLAGDDVVNLFHDGRSAHLIRHPRIAAEGHGTGCVLSSAIAARIALGESLPDAIRGASELVHRALERGYRVGAGTARVLNVFAPADGV